MKIIFNGVGIRERIQIRRVFNFACKFLNQPVKFLEADVSFVDEKEIEQLNKEFRDIDRVTDVLSFPNIEARALPIDLDEHAMDVDPSSGRLSLGDIIICKSVAISQAEEYGHSYTREICFLALHGLLHLLGYDHIEDNDRRVMEDAQESILSLLQITRRGTK